MIERLPCSVCAGTGKAEQYRHPLDLHPMLVHCLACKGSGVMHVRRALPPQVQCRECGARHYSTVCPLCKVPTPHLAILKGATA